MATNDLSPDDLLRLYTTLHEPKTQLNPMICQYLDSKKELLAHNIVVYSCDINGYKLIPHNQSIKINILDFMINLLGCILVNAKDHLIRCGIFQTPIFNPAAMLESCHWAYSDPTFFSVSIHAKYGLCDNISLNLSRNWDNNAVNSSKSITFVKGNISLLIGHLSQLWEFYSGSKIYPVPEFRCFHRVNYSERPEMASRKYSLASHSFSGMYKEEYGQLRLELAKFILDQLIVYRMKNA